MESNYNMKRIEEFTTEELLDQLVLRFDGCLFHGVKLNYKSNDRYVARYKGAQALILGLIEMTRDSVGSDYLEDMEFINEGEEEEEEEIC